MWIEAIEAASAADTVDHGSLGAELVALREVHAFKTGDLAAALEAARLAITLDFDDALQARSAACCIYGSALYFSGSIDEAQATFRRAVQLAEKIGDRRRRIYALGYLALIAAESGQLADAEHQIRRATGVGTDLAGGEHFVNAIVSLAAATVLDARWRQGCCRGRGSPGRRLGPQGCRNPRTCQGAGGQSQDPRATSVITRRRRRAGNEASALLRGCADADIAQTLLTAAQRGRRVAVTSRNQVDMVTEELTAKEHEVLRLLATRLSRREIGQRLYVSLNTVKTHQRALYRKLGVENRAAAVARARELGPL